MIPMSGSLTRFGSNSTSSENLGSARRVLLWVQDSGPKLLVMRRNVSVCKIEWRPAGYHMVLQILRHPIGIGGVRVDRAVAA